VDETIVVVWFILPCGKGPDSRKQREPLIGSTGFENLFVETIIEVVLECVTTFTSFKVED